MGHPAERGQRERNARTDEDVDAGCVERANGCALVSELAAEWQEPDGAALRSLARFILESPDIAAREPPPEGALRLIFTNLRRGWR
jgi:hypothetical protein